VPNSFPFDHGGLAADPDAAAMAARWLARHDRGLTAAEAAEFAQWRAAAAAHGQEFDRIAGTWAAAEGLKADGELVALALRLDLETLELKRQARIRRRRQAWTGALAAAASVAIAWAVWWRAPETPRPTMAAAVEVVPATVRRVALADGSVAEVRGNSEVVPQFTATERRVRLVRGEAHFVVSKDAARPFVVEAGGLAVRAVGTAFNVRLDEAAIEVTVTEGKITLHETARVSADAPTLVAGQRVVVELIASGGVALARASIDGITPAEVDRTLAWQGTRLLLNRATLAEAVEAFNQHGAVRLEIGDATLRSRQLSGTFGVANAEALVRLLEQAAEVRVERRADGVVVLRAAR